MNAEVIALANTPSFEAILHLRGRGSLQIKMQVAERQPNRYKGTEMAFSIAREENRYR